MTDDITYTYGVDGCYMGHVASYDTEVGHGIVDCNSPKYQSARPFTLQFFVRDYAGRNNTGRYLKIYQYEKQIGEHYKSSHSDQVFITKVFDQIMDNVPIKMVYWDQNTSKIICQRTTLLTLNDTGIFPSETETESQGVIDKIETVKNELTTGLSGIAGGISDLTSSISSTVSNKLNNLSTSFEDKFNLDDGTIVRYLNDIKHDVDNINFPDLSGLSNSVDDLKDSIGNITFPDLSGLTNTLDNVKNTLDNLSFPTLNDILGLLNGLKNDIFIQLSVLNQLISVEKNNIIGHIDSKTSDLSTDLSDLIRSVKIDISNLEFPDLQFIIDDFSSVESKIEGLKFPTIDDIEEKIINAADTIADKILERILDEIERRYNK